MRLLLITTAVAMSAGSAWASSIEDVVSGQAVNSSIATISCQKCPALQDKKKVTYVVPEIEKGSETVELKEINGEMKIVRTEAWLGGSPVVFVSKPSEDAVEAAKAAVDGPLEADVASTTNHSDAENSNNHDVFASAIDETAKTAAVHAMTRAEPAVAATVAGSSRHFDPTSLELRLN